MQVLLVRAGALGDVLLLRRAIAALRSAGHRLRLVAPAPGGVLVGPGPGEVDAVLPWDAPDTAALLDGDLRAGAVREAIAAADLAIAWTRSADVARSLGALVRRVIAHDPAPPPGEGHASRWLARALEPLGLDSSADPPLLSFTRAERDEAARRTVGLPPRFLAIHPGSGSPAKNWPADRFVTLAERLRADAGVGERFLLSLGPAEVERGVEAPPGALVALDWPLRVLGAALARAGVYVGNDSGASHLAAAAGAPTLALFGPTDPTVWAPIGPRVVALSAAGGRLGSLGVETVVRAASELLATTSGASGPPSG